MRQRFVLGDLLKQQHRLELVTQLRVLALNTLQSCAHLLVFPLQLLDPGLQVNNMLLAISGNLPNFPHLLQISDDKGLYFLLGLALREQLLVLKLAVGELQRLQRLLQTSLQATSLEVQQLVAQLLLQVRYRLGDFRARERTDQLRGGDVNGLQQLLDQQLRQLERLRQDNGVHESFRNLRNLHLLVLLFGSDLDFLVAKLRTALGFLTK